MSIRKLVVEMVNQNDLDGVVALAENEPLVLRYLISLLYERHGERRWRAIAAIGMIAARDAERDLERVLDLLRRLFWSLNDESGNVAWGVPEVVGEIVARRPDLFGEFAAHLIYNYLDELPLRRGVIWAVGRVGRENSGLVDYALPMIGPFLADPDPEIRGYTLWALLQNGVMPAQAEKLRDDETVIELWEAGRLLHTPIKDIFGDSR